MCAEPEQSDRSEWKGVSEQAGGERKRRLRFNSDAQKRYRLRQKKKVQGLQSTLDELSSKLDELRDVKEKHASLQVLILPGRRTRLLALNRTVAAS